MGILEYSIKYVIMGAENCDFGDLEINSFFDFKRHILGQSQELEGELRNKIIDSEPEFARFSLLVDSEIDSLDCDEDMRTTLKEIALNASEEFENYSFQIRSQNIFAAIHGTLEISKIGELPNDESIMRVLGIPDNFIFQRLRVSESDGLFQQTGEKTLYFTSPDEILRYSLKIGSDNSMVLGVSYGLRNHSFNFLSNIDSSNTRNWRNLKKYVTPTDLQDTDTYEIGYASPHPDAVRRSIEFLLGELPDEPRSRNPETQILIDFKSWLKEEVLLGTLNEDTFIAVFLRLNALHNSNSMVTDFLSSSDPSLLHFLLESTSDRRILGLLFSFGKNSTQSPSPLFERAVREKIQPELEEMYPFVFSSESFLRLPLNVRDVILEIVGGGGLTENTFNDFVDFFYSTFFVNISERIISDIGWKLHKFDKRLNPLEYFKVYAELVVEDGEFLPQGAEALNLYIVFSGKYYGFPRKQALNLATMSTENYVDTLYNIPYLVKEIAFGYRKSNQVLTYSQWQQIIESINKAGLDSVNDENLIRDIANRYSSIYGDKGISSQDTISFFENLGRLIEIHSSIFPHGFNTETSLGSYLNPLGGGKIDLNPDSIGKLIYRWKKLPSFIATSPEKLSQFMYRFKDINKGEIDMVAAMPRFQLSLMMRILDRLNERQDTFMTPDSAAIFLGNIQKIENEVHANFIYSKWLGSGDTNRSTYRFGSVMSNLDGFQGYWGQLNISSHNNISQALVNVLDNYLRQESITPEFIIEHQEFIFVDSNGFSNQLILSLMSIEGGNPQEIMKSLSECEACKNLNKITRAILLDYAQATRDLESILELATILEQLIRNNSPTANFIQLLLYKIPRNELLEHSKLLLDPNFSIFLSPVIESYPQEIRSYGGDFINRYMTLEDISDPQKLSSMLESFLRSIAASDYDKTTDPTGAKMDALIYNFETVLQEESTDILHISFILNVMIGESFEYNGEDITLTNDILRNVAFDMFRNNRTEQFQKKGALLIIGLGISTSEFTVEELQELTRISVDRNLTRFIISEDITQQQLDYVSDKDIPLSLYFSILSTLREEESIGDFERFLEKITIYQNLRDEPIFIGQTLALYHEEGESVQSNINGSDGWDTGFYGDISSTLDVPFQSLRHGAGYETKDSMFAYLENATQTGPLTLLIGGHGNDDIISFGSESFNIQELFDSLKTRQENVGGQGEVRIIFSSCYSETNLQRLFQLWGVDERTRDIPLTILSSSSEGASSYFIADDAWRNYARGVKSGVVDGTWASLYREVESRNYVLTKPRKIWNNSVNSNMSLWLNGVKLG